MKKLILILGFLLLPVRSLFPQTGIDNVRSTDITPQELYEHIKYLASYTLEGRAPGTNGDKLAQEYLSRELELYNIAPEGDDSSYIQNFNLKNQGYVSAYVTDIKFNINNKPLYLTEDEVQLMYESHNGFASGKLMFAGYGINSGGNTYTDFIDSSGREIDAEGKILIILDGVPGYGNIDKDDYDIYNTFIYKLAALSNKKMSGIILVQPKQPPGFADNFLSRYEPPVYYFTAGVPLMIMRKRTADDLFKKCGYNLDSLQDRIDRTLIPNTFEMADSYGEFSDKVRRNFLTTGNIIGFIEGSDTVYKKEVIVIGAHYDHEGKKVDAYNNVRNIYFGADDNASGTAGILEIAQKLSADRQLLKRSVLIMFFGAEEYGLLGSRYFMESDKRDKYSISAMINLDMIGRMNDSKLTVYGMGTMPYWMPAIKDFNKRYNFKIKFPGSDPGRSDQKSFIDMGIPSLHFFTGEHKDYHTSNDITDRINIKDAGTITKLVYDVILDICTNESLQFYDNSLPDEIDVTNEIQISEMYGLNTGKVYLGCTFDLFKSVNGLYVEGVTINSPAEICGLRSGDRIIKIGDATVKNITDYAEVIKKYSPYQKTKFTVMRGKKEIKIMVLFGYAE